MIIDKVLLLKINFIESFGYFLVFLATLFEASPFIGIFIPGSILIFLAGFAAKLQLMNFKIVVFLAILGAILGDVAGYLFGKYCGKEFLHKYGKYFLIRKEYIEKSCEIVHGHTGKSLVFGRLNPITRSVAPFIVGAHKVKFGKFMFFNIIGGVLWGFVFVSLGYIFGNSYQFALDYEKWIVIATVFLILAYYLYYFIKMFFKKSNSDCITSKKP
ncbi:MAG: DedA family protein [Nanoarchaeota archaeon]|nr:DedA family protein [Nanoarchaeota archaeon]